MLCAMFDYCLSAIVLSYHFPITLFSFHKSFLHHSDFYLRLIYSVSLHPLSLSGPQSSTFTLLILMF